MSPINAFLSNTRVSGHWECTKKAIVKIQLLFPLPSPTTFPPSSLYPFLADCQGDPQNHAVSIMHAPVSKPRDFLLQNCTENGTIYTQ